MDKINLLFTTGSKGTMKLKEKNFMEMSPEVKKNLITNYFSISSLPENVRQVVDLL